MASHYIPGIQKTQPVLAADCKTVLSDMILWIASRSALGFAVGTNVSSGCASMPHSAVPITGVPAVNAFSRGRGLFSIKAG